MDTIFRNYPSPALFLHKTITESGKTTYHVVDGKQRIETILMFVNNKIRLSPDYGDVRLDNRRWSDLKADSELRRMFWNYQLTVEMIDFDDSNIVNQVFDRLNRNARRLTNQELRHAKFDGWFAQEAEREAAQTEWKDLSVTTSARSKRMADVQFMSEMMLISLEEKMFGFDQDLLDRMYAKYDDIDEPEEEINIEAYRAKFDRAKFYLVEVNRINGSVSSAARAIGNIYTLWALVSLEENLPDPDIFAQKYADFLEKLTLVTQSDNFSEFSDAQRADLSNVISYYKGMRGANTDLSPRQERFEALRNHMVA